MFENPWKRSGNKRKGRSYNLVVLMFPSISLGVASIAARPYVSCLATRRRSEYAREEMLFGSCGHQPFSLVKKLLQTAKH